MSVRITEEFSEEELEKDLEKVLNPTAGRPSRRTTELRERIQEARRFKDLIRIMDSGLLEKLEQEERNTTNKEEPSKEPPRPAIEPGVLSQLLNGDSKAFKKLIDDNSTEALSTAIKKGLPIIGALAGVWLAEDNVKGFPRVLHTGVDILNMIILVLNAIMKFLGSIGDIDIIGDAQQSIFSAIGKRPESARAKAAKKASADRIQERVDSGDSLGAAVEALTREEIFGFFGIGDF